MHVFDCIADAVGKTPMVRLSRFGAGFRHELFGKCEFLNPGGSVKDRIALHMVAKARESGKLKPGATIVEATAGNTGIGLALAAALGGYKLITVVSDKVSSDKTNLLRALGAEVIVVPRGKPQDDPDHFMNRAKKLADDSGGWFADQFYNETNVEIHYKTTGPEIWEQTGGAVDVLIAGVGTGGTITGAGRYLKERKPSVKVILADPVGSLLADLVDGKTGSAESYIVEGIGQDFVPGNFDMSIVDQCIKISDAESISAARKLFAEEAIFVGSSGGCIAAAASKYCESSETSGEKIVLILPDSGRGYISTIYNPEWVAERFGHAIV